MKHENLINLDEQLKILDKKRAGKLKQGLGIGVPEFDTHIRLKPRDFTVIAGHANVGKTTIVLWIMLVYAVKHGTKWLVYSSENNAYSLIDKLISMKMREKIEQVSDLEFYNARDFILEHFKFVNDEKTYSAYDLLEIARDMLDTFQYNGFLIDPYNSLTKDRNRLQGLSVHDYDYEVASEFRLFCKKYNVSIFLNAHGQTDALRKYHSKDEEYLGYPLEGHPRPLAMADLEGGSKWASRCDNMWCVHRYSRHENLYNQSLIHVNKVKETESGGTPTFFNEPVRLQMRAGNSFLIGGRYDPLVDSERVEEVIKTNPNDDIF